MAQTSEERRRERMRPSSCRLKNHYDTKAWAERARRKQQTRYGWLMYAYQCRDCGEWHLARYKVDGKPVPIIGWVPPTDPEQPPSEVMEVES